MKWVSRKKKSQLEKKYYQLPIKVALAKGCTSYYLKCQIIRRKLYLTLSQKHLLLHIGPFLFEHFAVVFRYRSKNALGSTNSDLKCTHVSMLILLGNLICKIWMDETTAIAEAVAIALNVGIVLANKCIINFCYLFGSWKALASACIPLKNVFFVLELSHTFDYYVFCDTLRNLSQKPARVILQLWIWITQKAVLKISSRIETIL